MISFFDVHTHTQASEYDNDREEAIKRALGAGVGFINVGTDKESSKKAIEIAEKYPEGVFAAVGLHPSDLESQKEIAGKDFDYDFYKKLALSSEKVVAIGECGLDYSRVTDEELKKRQEIIFKKQIELSLEVKKPLMIHCREAFGDLIRILGGAKLRAPDPGIIHFFTGTLGDAEKLLDLGFYFSFGGVITFTRDYDEAVKFIPLERILLETDAPYVSPVPYRGKRNEPVYVLETAQKLAEIKGAALGKAAQVTTANAKSIFKI